MDMKKLLETVTKFAGQAVGQKPGDQWKGTDSGPPGKKLVGDSILKDLSKGPTAKTKEQKLAEEFAKFMEDDLGVEEKRPGRKSDRPSREYTKNGKPSKRYTPVKEGWMNGSDRVNLPDGPMTYWNGTGRLQNEYNELYEKLVPSQGAAETLEGEVIRASSKIVYRHYNDGDEFNKASFDQLKPFIGTVTSYDDLAEKAIEFALRAQGNYHPNAGWDSLDVMDYGPSEEEEYDDEEDDDSWDHDDDEDLLGEGAHDAAFIDDEDAWYNMADFARAEFKKGKTVQDVIKYLRDNDYLGPQDTNNFMKTVRGEKWNESADMFKAGQRAIKNIKSTEQQRKSEANKMAQAQSQIDVDRENERDRFSQEELYPSDDSHDLDEGEYEDEDQGFFVAIGSEDNGGFVGMVTKDGGKWRESAVTGRAPYNWGGSYMGYLTPDDVMQWIQKDYRNYDVEGPFSSEEEAREHAQMQYGLDEAKHFKTAYGWAGGRNEKTGKMYKHPDQIKADREAKKTVAKDAFNNMFGGNASDLTRDLKIREAASNDKLVARAHAMIRKHGDADMSHSEFMQLLTANGIPEDVAHHVASDYRPVSESWESGPEERTTRERDPDAEYDARRQEKLDAEADSAPKTTAYQCVGRGPDNKANFKFGPEFATQGEAVAYRKKLMANPKTPNPTDIGIRTISRVAKGINEDVSSTDPLEGALLNAIQELVSQGHKDVDPMVLTNMVVAATSRPFLLKDLVDANNNSLAVQHYIDSISPSKVKFSTDTLTVKNEDPNKDKTKARAGVSSMASRAANRSRLGEGGETPLQNKDDYNAKRKALQDIQLDPDTHKDPQLKAELARRLGSLNQQYTDLQSKLREFKESRGHKVIATKLGNMDRMNTVQIPTPAERREQLRIAKEKGQVGKKQVKEYGADQPQGTAAPGANTQQNASGGIPVANDPKTQQQAKNITQATNALKAATGTSAPSANIVKALNTAMQGKAIGGSDIKTLEPMMDILGQAAQDPKVAQQFKGVAQAAKQSQALKKV